MKNPCRQDYDLLPPGWGERERPDFIIRGEDSDQAVWVKHKRQGPPEKYHLAFPDKNRRGYIIYILILAVVLGLIVLLI